MFLPFWCFPVSPAGRAGSVVLTSYFRLRGSWLVAGSSGRGRPPLLSAWSLSVGHSSPPLDAMESKLRATAVAHSAFPSRDMFCDADHNFLNAPRSGARVRFQDTRPRGIQGVGELMSLIRRRFGFANRRSRASGLILDA